MIVIFSLEKHQHFKCTNTFLLVNNWCARNFVQMLFSDNDGNIANKNILCRNINIEIISYDCINILSYFFLVMYFDTLVLLGTLVFVMVLFEANSNVFNFVYFAFKKRCSICFLQRLSKVIPSFSYTPFMYSYFHLWHSMKDSHWAVQCIPTPEK